GTRSAEVLGDQGRGPEAAAVADGQGLGTRLAPGHPVRVDVAGHREMRAPGNVTDGAEGGEHRDGTEDDELGVAVQVPDDAEGGAAQHRTDAPCGRCHRGTSGRRRYGYRLDGRAQDVGRGGTA